LVTVTDVKSGLRDGKKQYDTFEEEYRHSRWKQFRKFASHDTATEECSTLPKRMKLEASDEEEEIIDEDEMMTVEESGLVSEDTSVDTEVRMC